MYTDERLVALSFWYAANAPDTRNAPPRKGQRRSATARRPTLPHEGAPRGIETMDAGTPPLL